MGLWPSDLWSDLKRSGFSKDTIRFYEKIGLIRLEEDDWRNRYQSKDYSGGVFRRLMAIRKMKEYGFTLNETSHRAGAIFNELLNSTLSMFKMRKKI